MTTVYTRKWAKRKIVSSIDWLQRSHDHLEEVFDKGYGEREPYGEAIGLATTLIDEVIITLKNLDSEV